MAASLPHHRFTVDEYERMIEVGILTEDDRVELLAGEIVEMSPIGPRHASCVTTLNWLLTRAVPDDVRVAVHNPIRLPNESEPEPDLSVIRAGDYTQALPTPADVFAVIEVVESTRVSDRETKLPLYAAAGIAEAWLVDFVANRIERHTEPGPDGYGAIVIGRRGSVLDSTIISGLQMPVDTILGVTT